MRRARQVDAPPSLRRRRRRRARGSQSCGALALKLSAWVAAGSSRDPRFADQAPSPAGCARGGCGRPREGERRSAVAVAIVLKAAVVATATAVAVAAAAAAAATGFLSPVLPCLVPPPPPTFCSSSSPFSSLRRFSQSLCGLCLFSSSP